MAKVLTPARRARLEKLAAYLESLPKSYRRFDMVRWISSHSLEAEVKYALENGGVKSCGTVACAVGHGPAAGVLVPKKMVSTCLDGRRVVQWRKYAELFIGEWGIRDPGYPLFNWLFSDDWSDCDNHHHGAAARIRYALDHGGPPEGFEFGTRKWRASYASYRVGVKAQESGEDTARGSPREAMRPPSGLSPKGKSRARQGLAHPSTPES